MIFVLLLCDLHDLSLVLAARTELERLLLE